MARIELAKGVTLKGARRILNKRGENVRITRRHGKLYTIKTVVGKQPNTDKQLECRELLKRANVMVKEDLAKPGRREHWEKMAKETGYKTVVGCARAWYVAWMKGEAEAWEKITAEKAKALTSRTGRKIKKTRMAFKGKKSAKSIKNSKKTKQEDVMVIGKRWSIRRKDLEKAKTEKAKK